MENVTPMPSAGGLISHRGAFLSNLFFQSEPVRQLIIGGNRLGLGGRGEWRSTLEGKMLGFARVGLAAGQFKGWHRILC